MAPESTTPAPFKITGDSALLSIWAAFDIACSPPEGSSNPTISGSSMSIIWVQKSLGIFICAGPDARLAFIITRLRTSATRDGSLTSSWKATISLKRAICSTSWKPPCPMVLFAAWGVTSNRGVWFQYAVLTGVTKFVMPGPFCAIIILILPLARV